MFLLLFIEYVNHSIYFRNYDKVEIVFTGVHEVKVTCLCDELLEASEYLHS
jgi:hypothetical protein